MGDQAPRVAGLDLSLTGSGIVTVAWELGGLPVPRLEKIGRQGITTMRPREAVAELDGLAMSIVSAVRGSAGYHAVELVTIEGAAFSRARGGVYERGYLWYAVVQLLTKFGVPVVAVPPNIAKAYVTGAGNSSKGAVIDGLSRRFPMFEHKGDPDLADASALATVAALLTGRPLADVPKANMKSIPKLALPDEIKWSAPK